MKAHKAHFQYIAWGEKCRPAVGKQMGIMSEIDFTKESFSVSNFYSETCL